MSSQLHFDIQAQIAHMNIDDINFFAAVRTPITKQAGFCVLKCFFSQVMARQMQSDINRNIFPDVNVAIYMYDEANNNQLKFICDKKFKCLNIQVEGTLRFEEDRQYVTFILTHPIIYYISNNNTFNQIFLDQTAYNVLKAYEGFLTSNFGDIFHFRHIGADKNKNGYVYEQLLTRASNDLAMPDYLINTYKINNSFCFYFFDPFYINKDAQNEVTCHYINLDAKDNFKNVNVHEYADMNIMTNHVKKKNINDIFQKLIDKDGHRIILNQQDIQSFYEKKPKQTGLPKKLKPVLNEETLIAEGGRSIQSVMEKSITNQNYPNGSATSTIYCPDSIDNGEQRFNKSKELLKDKLMSLHYYEMSNCLPEYPQFGQLYNLEEHNDSYIYTPLNIVNVFYRKVFREPYLYHMAKTVMIRYKVE